VVENCAYVKLIFTTSTYKIEKTKFVDVVF